VADSKRFDGLISCVSRLRTGSGSNYSYRSNQSDNSFSSFNSNNTKCAGDPDYSDNPGNTTAGCER
jgi:hypothetical protein